MSRVQIPSPAFASFDELLMTGTSNDALFLSPVPHLAAPSRLARRKIEAGFSRRSANTRQRRQTAATIGRQSCTKIDTFPKKRSPRRSPFASRERHRSRPVADIFQPATDKRYKKESYPADSISQEFFSSHGPRRGGETPVDYRCRLYFITSSREFAVSQSMRRIFACGSLKHRETADGERSSCLAISCCSGRGRRTGSIPYCFRE